MTAMDVTVASTPAPTRKHLVVLIAAGLLVVGAAGFFLVGPTTAPRQWLAPSTRRACTTSKLMVTSKDFGSHLSSNDRSFTTEAKIEYWNFEKAKGTNPNTTDIFKLGDPGSNRYLTATGSDSVDMKKSTGGKDQQWKISAAGCASGGNYYYLQNVKEMGGDENKGYLESGFFFPGITNDKGHKSQFYITSKTGQLLCSVAQGTWQCDKQCKTGLLVPWHKSDIPETNATKQVEADALVTCNKHCKTCNPNDKNCKVCAGTLDRFKDFTNTKKAKTSQTTSYFRQCDCNSAYKVVTMSLMPLLFLLINFKLQN